MTLFLDFRTASDAGDILQRPRIYDAGPTAPAGGGIGKPLDRIPDERIANRHVVLATHGFNVSRVDGISCLAALEQKLNLGPDYAVIGVLWPGSWHHLVINYPSEGRDASKTGDCLAAFLATDLTRAASLSFLSHSLGGRVMLQAVRQLKGRAREVCVTAAAVDSRSIAPGRGYDAVRGKADRITVLSSESDLVLCAVYPAGALAALALHLDDHPFGAALGLKGSDPRVLPAVANSPIPRNQGHDHGDYYPDPARPNARADRSIAAMARAVAGDTVYWPHSGRIDR